MLGFLLPTQLRALMAGRDDGAARSLEAACTRDLPKQIQDLQGLKV